MKNTLRFNPRIPARPHSYRPRSYRMALVGAVAVLALTACGTNDSGTSATPTTLTPPVIQIAGGSPISAAAEGAPAATDSKMIAAYLSYTYTGPSVDLTSPAASWFFAPDAQPSDEQIAALADAFGVTGDVASVPLDRGGGWMVGPDDYSSPSVTVSSDSLLSWWFNPGVTEVAVAEPCAYYPAGDPAADPDTATMPVCEEPQPPANVPTAAEAESMARELFAKIGLDISHYEIETYADEWGAGVTGFLLLEGIRSNLSISVGYGAEGALTWAGGFLATPQRGADYPRVGIEAAVQRLNDQANSWMTMGDPTARSVEPAVEVGAPDIAPEAPVSEPAVPQTAPAPGTVDPAVSTVAEPPPGDSVGVEPPTPDDSVVIEPMPVDCTDPAVSCVPDEPTEMEPIEITLVNVRPSLEQVWAVDETVWLLPGYAFEAGADQGEYSVIAVADEFLDIAEPEPIMIEPMPAETVVPGSSGAGTNGVGPDGAVIGSDGTSVLGPDGDVIEPLPAEVPIDEAQVLVGMSEADAAAAAKERGWQIRAARIDGEDLALTADYSPTRINLAVTGGVVTEVLSIG
jgi:hypothetical protein